MCSVRQLEVTWPATIERDGLATTERLAAVLTPTNVTPEVFDSLTETLVRGKETAPAVSWSVPAFNTSPGGIAVAHGGTLRRGQVLRVHGVLDGGGWGVAPDVARDSARVGVEAGDFAAQSASGTITVLETEPVALRFDVTASDSAGGFSHHTHAPDSKDAATCSRCRTGGVATITLDMLEAAHARGRLTARPRVAYAGHRL
jgi:hypothetical protein